MIMHVPSHLRVGLLLLAAAGCRDADADAPNATGLMAPLLTTVLIDRSGSRTPNEIAGDRQLLREIIEELGFGERIVVLQVHHAGRSDGARRWMSEMPMPVRQNAPTPVDRQSLTRTRSAAALAATELFDSMRPNRTDLIATLFDASDIIRGSQGARARIIMLSDMMQSTPEMDMEKGGVSSIDDWLRERKRQGLLPDLARACVVVIGGDRSTESGVRAFRFWQDYFAAAGAELKSSNYRYTAMGGRRLRC
ncbi:MAG: hypothetical protein ACREOK_11110 [Gemmatimonadaceae bacterium]